jgi:hypothetical protein
VAFEKALKTGYKVICDKTKTYYFSRFIDLRQNNRCYLDGNGAKFVNFHLRLNVNDSKPGEIQCDTSYSNAYSVIENMYFGNGTWKTTPEQLGDWQVPLITTGSPMTIREIQTQYPFVMATTDNYIDYMRCENWTNVMNPKIWVDGSGNNLDWNLDAISCYCRDGKYRKFGDNNSQSQGDAWVISQCREITSSRRPDYKMMTIVRRQPISIQSCVQCSFSIGKFSQVIFNGGHWESESNVTFLSDKSNTKVTYLNCYFYHNHVMLNSRAVTYQNCYFRVGADCRVGDVPLSKTTGDVGLYNLKCSLIDCYFGESTYIDTRKL